MSLLPQIETIRAYTAANAYLMRAHHFLFDLPINPPVARCDFLVLGVNPGEQKGDWDIWPTPTKETSAFDFRQQLGKRPVASNRWRSLVEYFCGTADVVMSEFFLWSSVSTGKAFEQKFGTSIKQSPHLRFCADQNLALIDHYQVKAVIAPGLKSLKLFGDAYGLSHVNTVKAENGHTLVEHYERDGTPWLFTKHWSAAFGFSKAQREAVKAYIALSCDPRGVIAV